MPAVVEQARSNFPQPFLEAVSPVAVRQDPCGFLFTASPPLPMAVLKLPHSKRCRADPVPSIFAKRLECGAFTAAFSRTADVSSSTSRSKLKFQVIWNFQPASHWRAAAAVCDTAAPRKKSGA